MGDPNAFQRWMLRALFLALFLVIVASSLLPVRPEAPQVPGPDLVLCLICAWLMRRPDVMAAWLIVGAVLLTDFLFQRPPGMWAALVLVASEMLRRETRREGERSFLLEYGIVALAITGAMLVQRVLLTVLFVQQPPLGAMLLHLLTTLVSYPLVVIVSVYVFGIRPIQKDESGLQGLRT